MKLKEFKQIISSIPEENDELDIVVAQLLSGESMIIHHPFAGWATTVEGEFILASKEAMDYIINDLGKELK